MSSQFPTLQSSPLRAKDLERLQVLARLTPEEIAALADLATGMALYSRARKWLLILAGTIGAVVTLVTAAYQFVNFVLARH